MLLLNIHFIKIDNVEGIGEVVVYDMSYDSNSGMLFKGGMMSLDKKWMFPVLLGEHRKHWHEMNQVCKVENNTTFYEYYMESKPIRSNPIYTEVIDLVDLIAFEKEFLKT